MSALNIFRTDLTEHKSCIVCIEKAHMPSTSSYDSYGAGGNGAGMLCQRVSCIQEYRLADTMAADGMARESDLLERVAH